MRSTASNLKKQRYCSVSVAVIEFVNGSKVLCGSVIDENAAVSIPRGQKVDEYDFSDSSFSHEWDISDPE